MLGILIYQHLSDLVADVEYQQAESMFTPTPIIPLSGTTWLVVIEGNSVES